MSRRYHVVVNPVSGAGKAPDFVEHRVLPLLDALNIDYDVHVTKAINDASRIGRELLLERDGHGEDKADETTVLVVAGGDGTAHEFMEGVLDSVRLGARLGRWEIITLPLGTANALHSTLFPPSNLPVPLTPRLEPLVKPEDMHALSSLLLSLEGGAPRPLPVTQTQLYSASELSSSSSSSPPSAPPIPSHIVLSTSLHACILADSEAHRTTTPGVERFKIAAAQNIGVFFPARVRLLPSASGVKQYNPRAKGWSEPFTINENEVEGPFAYFLSVTTTPRLEPTFVIAPTLARLPPTPHEGVMDVVVLRPLRDPRVKAALAAKEDPSAVWAGRAKEVLGAAYDDGKHISLVFGQDGNSVSLDDRHRTEDGGEVVVEVFRCAGFEWTPTDPKHEKSHIVCADGSLYTVPTGGKARAKVIQSHEGEGFWVWG